MAPMRSAADFVIPRFHEVFFHQSLHRFAGRSLPIRERGGGEAVREHVEGFGVPADTLGYFLPWPRSVFQD